MSQDPLNSLRKVARLNPHADLWLGPPTHGQWFDTASLTDPSNSILDQLLASISGHHNLNEDHLLASFFINGYSWPVAVYALGAYVLDKRVPDLDPKHIGFGFDRRRKRINEIGFIRPAFTVLKGDPAAGNGHVTSVAEPPELQSEIRTKIEAHFRPLVERLHRVLGWGERALWISVADRCLQALGWLWKHPGLTGLNAGLLESEAEAFLRAESTPWRNPLSDLQCGDQKGVQISRGSCCLVYRLPEGDYCSNCPISRTNGQIQASPNPMAN